MRCVRCHIDLVPETYEGTQIDRCARCRGVWLDSGELTKIVDTIGVVLPAAMIRDTLAAAFKGVPQDEQRSVERCPKCNAAMQAINYDYASGTVLDRCPAGHGTWLDGGELEKVQAHSEHWARQARQHQQHREDWASLVQGGARDETGVTDESRRQSMGPARYLISTIIRRCISR